MASQHGISLTVVTGSGNFQKNATVSDAQTRSVSKTLAASSTNVEVDIVLTRAQIKSLVLSNVGGDLTIKTNSTSAPGDTVTMATGDVSLWSSTAGIGTDPFATADVTKLYLTSTAGTVFNLDAVVSATNG